ncbi:MAG: glycosyltransferase family 4 protein [Acidobacteriota bacterium]|nr:glycosyltransferase family 4 protein [Acidobacteriota bacterium]MDH3524257.1 glycosyltransferase family 4 protein [Acidobacteriota bacterium]
MRVLLVANTLPPADLSGVGEQVMQLAAGLRDAGHEVEVLGRGPGGARGPKLLFPLLVVPPFLRACRDFRPHVIQVHESDGAGAALLARACGGLWDPVPLLVALLQVSYVEEMRAVRPLRAGREVLGRPGSAERRFRWTKAPLQVLLGWLTAWCADLVLTPSERTGDEVRRDYGAERTITLPNVKQTIAGHGAERPADEGFFLFVGRLRIRKGVEVLLAALAARGEGGEDGGGPRLVIAGDGEHRAALERAAARFGVADRVDFLGRRSAGEVRSLLRRCRALVVPSIYEGMPLVVLEAMEEGVPVVGSRVSGIPEVVSDRVTGWLVPPEDPGALAAALAEVRSDPEEARRRGRAGRERLDRRFRPAAAVALWTRHVAAAAPGRAARPKPEAEESNE